MAGCEGKLLSITPNICLNCGAPKEGNLGYDGLICDCEQLKYYP